MAEVEHKTIERRPNAARSNFAPPPEWGPKPSDPLELRRWMAEHVADGERRKRRGEDVPWVGELREER